MAEYFSPSTPPPFPPSLPTPTWLDWTPPVFPDLPSPHPHLFAIAIPPAIRFRRQIFPLPNALVRNTIWGFTTTHHIAAICRVAGWHVQAIGIEEEDGEPARDVVVSSVAEKLREWYDEVRGVLGWGIWDVGGLRLEGSRNLRFVMSAISASTLAAHAHRCYPPLLPIIHALNRTTGDVFAQWVSEHPREVRAARWIVLGIKNKGEFLREIKENEMKEMFLAPIWELARRGRTTGSLWPLVNFCEEMGLLVGEEEDEDKVRARALLKVGEMLGWVEEK